MVTSARSVFVLCTLSVAAACGAQDGPRAASGAASDTNAIPVTGTTVAEIGKHPRDIFEDRRGHLWFGTEGEGLYRYDGTTITRFTTADGVGHDRIRGFQEDEAGNLYIHSERYTSDPFTGITGISTFDGTAFTALTIPAMPSAMSEWKVQSGDLWFPGTQDSHAVFRYDGHVVSRLEFPATAAGDAFVAKHPRAQFPNMNYSPYDVYTIVKDSKGSVWFGTASLGACRFDGHAFAWISEGELEYGEMLSGDQSFGVRAILEGDDGRFWFSNVRNRFEIVPNETAGEGDAPIRFVKEKGPGDSKTLDGSGFDLFQSAVKDAHGDFWMSTWGGGVWRYDGKALAHYPVMEGDAPVLIISIHQDRAGTLWLATQEAGAYRFDGKTFEKFRP